MTGFIVLLVVFSLGLAIGEIDGYDRGVRVTKAVERLRAAFPLPRPMRPWRATHRRP